MIAENLKKVRDNIEASCEKAGRKNTEVKLIAVSKTKPVSMLMEAYEAGVRDFGENKVQEIMDKYEKLPGDVRWHMIGHLQTNKVKYIIDKVCLIHSVDSLHLAREISRQAQKKGLRVDILVEVNVAGEETKFGTGTDSAKELVSSIAALPGIRVRGLMTVAPYVVDKEENRSIFVNLRKLAVDIKQELCEHSSCGEKSVPFGYTDDGMEADAGDGPVHAPFELSMGMTGDYEVAIQEGATMVRVGTGIFGERDYGVTAVSGVTEGNGAGV